MNLHHAETKSDIARCFSVMAELRGHLEEQDFLSRIREQQAEGYRLAYLDEGGEVVAVAGYRVTTNLFLGRNLYVDDLVTAAVHRSKGYGASLLAGLRAIALAEGCTHLHLDSGTQRKAAHRFYLREGMVISSFHFDEPLDGSG